jgi:hypothetical protein
MVTKRSRFLNGLFQWLPMLAPLPLYFKSLFFIFAAASLIVSSEEKKGKTTLFSDLNKVYSM